MIWGSARWEQRRANQIRFQVETGPGEAHAFGGGRDVTTERKFREALYASVSSIDLLHWTCGELQALGAPASLGRQVQVLVMSLRQGNRDLEGAPHHISQARGNGKRLPSPADVPADLLDCSFPNHSWTLL
jgi:hypothetical protein